MKTLLLCAAAAALAPAAALAAPTGPAPAVVSATLTPLVNQTAAAGHVRWRFARAVCVREATPGHYFCSSAHVVAGVPVDRMVDAWEVVVQGGRLRYGSASVCLLERPICVNTDFSPLTGD